MQKEKMNTNDAMRLPHNLICTNKSKRNMKIENTDEETSTGFVPAYRYTVCLKNRFNPIPSKYSLYSLSEKMSSFLIQ